MKKLLMCSSLFAFIVPSQAAAHCHDPEDCPPTFVKAWNKHDFQAMAAFWMDKGVLIDLSGRQHKGRSAIEKLFRESYGAANYEIAEAARARNVEAPGNTALITWKGRITGRGSPRDHFVMAVMTRVGVPLEKRIENREYEHRFYAFWMVPVPPRTQ